MARTLQGVSHDLNMELSLGAWEKPKSFLKCKKLSLRVLKLQEMYFGAAARERKYSVKPTLAVRFFVAKKKIRK